jgi:hypothetical protein
MYKRLANYVNKLEQHTILFDDVDSITDAAADQFLLQKLTLVKIEIAA